jgi:hypothetical protein
MSSRARLIAGGGQVIPFTWGGGTAGRALDPMLPQTADEQPAVVSQQALATIEREAFAKGYEQGERAGNEAAGTRGEAMLPRPPPRSLLRPPPALARSVHPPGADQAQQTRIC